ncbi:MAG: hypothetical protein ACYDHW_06975 [Syntrophorhabdaceae bacterium]
METLKDTHKGETAWIIGKGPSLANLTKEDIGKGPVIALNHAILSVEALGLDNPIYSMQKDGGDKRTPSADNLIPDCNYSGNCNGCEPMIKPQNATLLLHDLESKYCFPDYPKRHVLNLGKLGFPGNVYSLVMALRTAQYMGCTQFNFVSCDAHVSGNIDVYVPGEGIVRTDETYKGQVDTFPYFAKGLNCLWITPGELKISFGCITNDAYRLNTVLLKSALPGALHYVINPKSATEGLNTILAEIEKDAADVAILAHQDMYFRNGWLQKVREQIAKLPDSWVVAGIIGKDHEGRICGKLHDMRIVEIISTDSVHDFPHSAVCFDECVIIVNMKKDFRFDEALDGFDLYGTLCVLQAWEMGGTAWVIDAFAEHYCMRPFTWFPGDDFKARYKWLYNRYQEKFDTPDSTVFVNKPRFETSAAIE